MTVVANAVPDARAPAAEPVLRVRAASSCSNWSASATRRGVPTTIRTSSPAACASAC